jgi:16S rRNA (guanine966-N2)-methyltransferase
VKTKAASMVTYDFMRRVFFVAQGQIRIIGGMWRGRLLKVPNVPDLRPTPNRIRETVFNWLQPHIQGAYCLDLFAGSGALGFEALSRGAANVVMIDQAATAVTLLREAAKMLQTDNADIYQATVPEHLPRPAHLFNIVFLDPPFQHNLLLPCCFYLEENSFLADNAYIYIEAGSLLDANALPSNWQLLKCKQAGEVAYHLAMRTNQPRP